MSCVAESVRQPAGCSVQRGWFLPTETLHLVYSQSADLSMLEASICISIHLPVNHVLMATMSAQHACCGGAAVCRDAG